MSVCTTPVSLAAWIRPAMQPRIHENVPLAPFTTFGIGGPARYFADASTENAVVEALWFAKDHGLPVFILGGGSNLLVGDAGFPGLVIKVAIHGVEWIDRNGGTLVSAGAGEVWDRLVDMCIDRGLAGIECLSGIPGSAGGTPVQNVGAYGQEVSNVVTSVRAYDRAADFVVELPARACGFAYRTSIFNTSEKDRYVVLEVTYSLSKSGPSAIRYPELQRELGANPHPSLRDVREAVRRIRARKAMLLVEGDPDCRSAGSFFKNPIITEQEFADLQSRAGPDVPRYPGGPGKVKTAAAWLIERAGFQKGYSLGAAGLSSKHTLALVNKGGATAEDVLRLARQIHARVAERFGITLVPEPVLLGCNL